MYLYCLARVSACRGSNGFWFVVLRWATAEWAADFAVFFLFSDSFVGCWAGFAWVIDYVLSYDYFSYFVHSDFPFSRSTGPFGLTSA